MNLVLLLQEPCKSSDGEHNARERNDNSVRDLQDAHIPILTKHTLQTNVTLKVFN